MLFVDDGSGLYDLGMKAETRKPRALQILSCFIYHFCCLQTGNMSHAPIFCCDSFLLIRNQGACSDISYGSHSNAFLDDDYVLYELKNEGNTGISYSMLDEYTQLKK